MADNIDPSNIEQAEKFTKKLKDIQEEYENSVERVNEMMKVQIDAERTVADTLKEKYGAQLEFMTAIEKEAEIPDIATLASASTANDPTLNDAEIPVGSTTAEPRTDTEPTLDENSTPLISKLGLKPIVIANSPQAP